MIVVYIFVLGLCIGSFINALTWRLHEQSLPNKKRALGIEGLSIAKGRSMCIHCHHVLGVWDLVPVASWFLLRGRCRYCKGSISVQYPLVELLAALLFMLSFVFWPHELIGEGLFLFIVWLIALSAFIALAVYDIKWFLLPNKIVFPLLLLGTIQMIVMLLLFDKGLGYVLQATLSVIVAGGLFYALFQVSKGSWIGGGDVKLGYAIGLLLANPFLSALMLFLASLLGLVIALPAMVAKKQTITSKIPFGPYLIASTIIVIIWGDNLLKWYLGLLVVN